MNSRTFRLQIEITATPRVPVIEAGSTDAADEIRQKIALEAGLIAQRMVGPEYEVSVKAGHVIY
jgi:hypothetical protein